MLGGNRYADHGQGRLRGEHPGEMGGAAGPGDDHLDPPRRRGLRVAEEMVRAAMGGDHAQLARDIEHLEERGCLLEDREVRAAAADDPDDRPSITHHSTSCESAAQRIRPAASRAAASAVSGPSATAVTWPIFPRSNTRRFSYT